MHAQQAKTSDNKSGYRPAATSGEGLGLQCKLEIGSVKDPLEAEADAMADRVMRMPDTPLVQRKCAGCEEEKEKLQRKPLAASITPFIQTKGAEDGTASDAVTSQINATKGSGNDLDGNTKSFMESRFGADFSNVKIHTDDDAVQMNRELGAQAFTVGNDIFFNSGQYAPDSGSGKHLLAHELTHTVQQGNASSIQRKPSLTKADLNDIAEKVHKAIAGLGTDEEAAYMTLQRLEKDAGLIGEVSDIYQQKYGVTLEADIRDDFSDEELQYALELIGITPPLIDELIQSVPVSDSEYEFAARKVYGAMDQWGTNEEAIYGVLISMENVPERITKLNAAYTKKYPTGLHGGNLEHDIRDEMSGSELDYALLLLNVIPQGNTAILEWIRRLINTAVPVDTATEVMRSLNQVTTDRLRVFIIDMIRAGDHDKFKTNLMSPVAANFGQLVARVAAIEAEYADPTAGTSAATATQKTQITGILNQGMNVDPVTQVALVFVDDVGGKFYKDDVIETLEKEVTALTPQAIVKAAYPKFPWPRYEEMANEAKKRTDAVFGHYATGSTLTSAVGPGRNLFDFSQEPFSDAALLNFANYLVTGHKPWNPVYPGKRIHQVHNADLNRAPEKALLNTGLLDWMSIAGNKTRLLEVNKNWSGAQSGGNIFLQRWDVGDTDKNRAQFWKMFQTMIHEYLHKITHPDYSDKARLLGRAKQQVFTEGGTSYFDERVWKTLYPEEVRASPELREKVEGAVYPYNSNLIPSDSGYEQIEQFREIVALVGEANTAAAYFRGQTDRIGL
jgi:Domain of unknown function (DUF4157)/Annexin